MDQNTGNIKTAYHVRYDEAMEDVIDPPPNELRIRQAFGQQFPYKDTP